MLFEVDQTKINNLTVCFSKYVKLDRILEQLRKVYVAQTISSRFLDVPYTITCATALESRLNEEIERFLNKSFKHNARQMADSYLSMNFRGKLNAIVPFLTSNSFIFNPSHDVYKKLVSLIKVRNMLVHPKSFFENVKIQQEVDPDTGEAFPFPVSKTLAKLGEDLSLGSIKEYLPTEYHDALNKLERIFFKNLGKPQRLAKTKQIIPNVAEI